MYTLIPPFIRKRKKKMVSGFTLVEIILTISVMSVLSLFGASGYREYNENKALDLAAEEVKSIIEVAASRATSQVKPDIPICDDLPNPEPLYGYKVTVCPGNCSSQQAYELRVVCGESGEMEQRVSEVFTLPESISFSSNQEQEVLYHVLTGDVEGISYISISGYDKTRVINITANGVLRIANNVLATPTPQPTATPTTPPPNCDVPDAPTSLQPSGNRTPGTYTITWNNAQGALRHQIRIDDKTNAWTGSCFSVNSGDYCNDNKTDNSHQYTFQLGHSYDIWVQGSNDCGVGSAILVTVNIPAPTPTRTPTPTGTPVPPSLTFTASPTSVAYNGSSTLSWNSTNATSCTASNAWSGGKSVDGSQSTGALTGTRTYRLTCTGPGGSVFRDATVSVAAPPTPTPTATRTPTPIPTRTPTPVPNLITTSGYLSDKEWASATTGYGVIRKDRSVDNNPIRLNGVEYTKGIGTHAFSNIRYNIQGCSRFTADVGRDDESQDGAISFEVWANGVNLFDSGAMYNNTATKHIDVSLTGRTVLELNVLDRDGTYWDHSDWANAYIVCGSGSPPVTTNIISNPGLESGNSPWVGINSAVFCTEGTSGCAWGTNYGTRYIYLGGIVNSAEWAYQTVTIPANATAASLTFKYRIETTDGTTTAYDTTSHAIYNSSGTWLATLGGMSNVNHTGTAWRQGPTYNLLPYKGQSIRVRFGATNDVSNWTAFLYDDIEVNVTYAP